MAPAEPKEALSEIISISARLKEIAAEQKILRARKNTLNATIQSFLVEIGKNGLSYGGRIFCIKTSNPRKVKKKKEKEESIIQVLKNAGVEDPDEVLKEIKDQSREPPSVKTTISIGDSV